MSLAMRSGGAADAGAVLSYISAVCALAAGGGDGGGDGGGEGGGVGGWGSAAAVRATARGAAAAALDGGPVVALVLPGAGSPAGSGPGSLLLVDPAATTRQFAEALTRLDGSSAVSALLGLTAGAGALAALPHQLLAAVAKQAAEQALTPPSTSGSSGSIGTTANSTSGGGGGGGAPSLATYLLDVALALPPPFLDCPALLQLLLPPALRRAAEEEAAPPQLQQAPQAPALDPAAAAVTAVSSPAAAAATAAAALPGAVRYRALAALWFLGRRAGIPSLSSHAEAALRSCLAGPAAAPVPPAAGGPPAQPASLPSATVSADGGGLPHPTAAAEGGEAAGGARIHDDDGDADHGDDDDGGDDIVLVVPQPRRRSRPGTRGGTEVTAPRADAAAAAAAGAAAPGSETAAKASEAAAAGKRAQPPPPPLSRPRVDTGATLLPAAGEPGAHQQQQQQPEEVALPPWRLRGRVSPEEGRRVIESIRQQEFGVGVSASSEVAAVLSAQARRLQRALSRLAADLYSSRVHLLLELMQNADDCCYPPELAACGEEPRVALRVGAGGLAVATNEVGFTEADVRALCDVGASSKAAAKQQQQQQQQRGKQQDGAEERAQTGEKGIGFKSVFAISDAPAIYSNGFAFGFDARDPTGLGYVLPQPLDPASDPTVTTAAPTASPTAATTTSTAAVTAALSGLAAGSAPARGGGDVADATAGSPPPPPLPPPTGWGTVIQLPAASRLLPPPPPRAAHAAPAQTESPQQQQLQQQRPNQGERLGVDGVASSGGEGAPAGSGSGSWSSLAAGLVGQVRPGVLLFLRRVRQLEVVDELAGVRHLLRRRDREGGAVVEVTWRVEPLQSLGGQIQIQIPIRETVHTWIVGAATLAPPLVTRGSAGTRPAATTVQVALPLPPRSSRSRGQRGPGTGGGGGGGAADGSAARCAGGGGVGGSAGSCWDDDPGLGGCYVYATLPLRPSGLPFDLQADWLVPSSREDISGGEAWNQMLRDQVPAAFLSAIHLAMRLLPHMRRGAWLRYVPHNPSYNHHHHLLPPAGAPATRMGQQPGPGAVGGFGGGAWVAMPFLRPVVGAVAAALRATPCILSYTSDGGEGELLRPSQVVVGASRDLRRLLPASALSAATGLSYAATDGLAGPPVMKATETGGCGTSSEEEEVEVEEEEGFAAIAVESLPAPGVLSALGQQVFGARHAVAALQVMLQGQGQGQGPNKGQDQGQGQPPCPAPPSAEASAGGGAEWRWRVLASLEELLEEAEVQQVHGGGFGAASARSGPGTTGPASSLPGLLAALRGLPLVPLVGGRAAPAAEALMPPPTPTPLSEPLMDREGEGKGADGRTGSDGRCNDADSGTS
ncbi:hypothetical protein PLESTB_001820000, partial [Pleodorina starrii]